MWRKRTEAHFYCKSQEGALDHEGRVSRTLSLSPVFPVSSSTIGQILAQKDVRDLRLGVSALFPIGRF